MCTRFAPVFHNVENRCQKRVHIFYRGPVFHHLFTILNTGANGARGDGDGDEAHTHTHTARLTAFCAANRR